MIILVILKIFDSKIIDILLFAKYNDGSRFCGEVPVDVLNYAIYTIGNQLKWKADVHPLSFQNPNSMTVRFTDVLDTQNSYEARIDNFVYHYDRERYISWFHVSQVLPQVLIGKQIVFELLEYNGKSVVEPLKSNLSIHRYSSNQDIYKIFEKEFGILKNLLENFEGIDIAYEIGYFEKAPDLIQEVNECLQEVLDNQSMFKNVSGDENREIVFLGLQKGLIK